MAVRAAGRPSRQGPAPVPDPVEEDGRFRRGWIFAAVWLFYLGDPLSALLDQRSPWRRDLGLVALGAFVVAYLVAVSAGRRDRRTRRLRPLPVRWAQVLGLLGLAALVVPGAGQHAFATLPYVAALAVMNLPVRPAWVLVAALTVAVELLMHLVPGWADSGYGLGVLLAGVAVYGIRLAFERNARLVETQDELARLAVETERARIAGDLHDILGHSLTVVAVKAELAQRLLDVDPERARAELADLEQLSRDALADVRATALGVRGVSLPGEIATAREVLQAAGIEAVLPTAADEVPTRLRELFAWTVREAVTNVLRHSRAARCEVRLTPRSVEVLDDGVGAPDERTGQASGQGGGEGSGHGRGQASGQGLAGLHRRAAGCGAQLHVGNRSDGPGFAVVVEAPELPVVAAGRPRERTLR